MLIDINRTKDAHLFFVYDVDNDCLINNCTWADDKKGVFCITELDKNNKIVLDENKNNKQQIKHQNIKLLHLNCLSDHKLLKRLNPILKELI